MPLLHRDARRLSLMILAVAALLLWGGAATAGYVDLLWEVDADSLAFGGVRVPGPVADRADLLYPTSLSLAPRPRLQLDYSRQPTIEITQRRQRIAKLTTDGWDASLIWPLAQGIAGADTKWWGAVQWQEFSSGGFYNYGFPTSKHLSADFPTRMKAAVVAYRPSERWTYGAGWYDSRADANVWGSLLDDALDTDPGRGRLSFDLTGTSLVLEALRRRPGQQFGLRLVKQDADAELTAPFGQNDAGIAFSGDGWGQEAWWRRDAGHHAWFADVMRSHLSGDGIMAAANLSGGRERAAYKEGIARAGWMQFGPHHEQRFTLVYHRRRLDFHGFMGASALPPPFGEQYHGDILAALSTWQAAYAWQHSPRPNWFTTLAANYTYGRIDLAGNLGLISGFGADKTLFEMDNSAVHGRAILLTAGLGHQTPRAEWRFVYSWALGTLFGELNSSDANTAQVGTAAKSTWQPKRNADLGHLMGAYYRINF